MKHWAYTQAGDEFYLTLADMKACSHSGVQSADVQYVTYRPYVRRQLDALSTSAIRAELRNYGAWSEDELSDTGENDLRFVWCMSRSMADE